MTLTSLRYSRKTKSWAISGQYHPFDERSLTPYRSDKTKDDKCVLSTTCFLALGPQIGSSVLNGKVQSKPSSIPRCGGLSPISSSDERVDWNLIGKIVMIGPRIAPLRDRQLQPSMTPYSAGLCWLTLFTPTARTRLARLPRSRHPTTTQVPKKARGCFNSCTDRALIPPRFCADGNTACSRARVQALSSATHTVFVEGCANAQQHGDNCSIEMIGIHGKHLVHWSEDVTANTS